MYSITPLKKRVPYAPLKLSVTRKNSTHIYKDYKDDNTKKALALDIDFIF